MSNERNDTTLAYTATLINHRVCFRCGQLKPAGRVFQGNMKHLRWVCYTCIDQAMMQVVRNIEDCHER